MIYTVLRIDEDLDFGCEARRADEPVMAVVTLQDEQGNQIRMRYPDQRLYDQNINENDRVMITEEKEIIIVDK